MWVKQIIMRFKNTFIAQVTKESFLPHSRNLLKMKIMLMYIIRDFRKVRER